MSCTMINGEKHWKIQIIWEKKLKFKNKKWEKAKNCFFQKIIKKYKHIWKIMKILPDLDETQIQNFNFLHLAPTGPWDPSKYP